MSESESEKWAKLVGRGFAQLQNVVDEVIDFGFKQLKKAGEHPVKPTEKGNPYLQKAKKVGLGAIKFLGVLGDEYYKKYGDLKRKTRD